ncbi:MAG: DUF1059 domain-containing protein [Deltaproteobacteria bacterium]|nr:MAG: DUF1059 domain-containing protein [Deltaproteobacteria bacterium]
MAHHHKEYKQLDCRDFGMDCDFMVRAETEAEITKYGFLHGCNIHGNCGVFSEAEKKIKPLIKNVSV